MLCELQVYSKVIQSDPFSSYKILNMVLADPVYIGAKWYWIKKYKIIIFLDLLITHFPRVSVLNHEEKCPDPTLCRWKQTEKKISMYRATAPLKCERQQKILRRKREYYNLQVR